MARILLAHDFDANSMEQLVRGKYILMDTLTLTCESLIKWNFF